MPCKFLVMMEAIKGLSSKTIEAIFYKYKTADIYGTKPRVTIKATTKRKLEDLKVLRRSPDLLNNVKIGQGQLQLIMEQILFYHIWGLQTF